MLNMEKYAKVKSLVEVLTLLYSVVAPTATFYFTSSVNIINRFS